MSIITATYEALAASTELRGMLAANILDETAPAIYEHWAGENAPMPYVIMTFLTDESNHWAKHQTAVSFDIFTKDSLLAESIKDRIIKILDRQEIPAENENLIRFFYDNDDRLDEPEANITHVTLSFRAYYWRKTFIDYLNSITPHDEPPPPGQ